MQNHSLLWALISFAGLLFLLSALAAVVLMAYASLSHLGRADKRVAWIWHRGVAPFAGRIFAAGIGLQLLSFAGRMALGSL